MCQIRIPLNFCQFSEILDQLESILASYTTPPDFSAETEAFHSAIAPHNSEINDFYFGVHEDKILLGTSPAVRLFFELLFTAPYDPKHTIKLYGKVKPEDFGKIELDSRSLGEMKNISIFKNLPIFQLWYVIFFLLVNLTINCDYLLCYLLEMNIISWKNLIFNL